MTTFRRRLFAALWISSLQPHRTAALQFAIKTATSCGDVNLTWENAVGSMYLLVVPVDAAPGIGRLNISIPATATSPYLLSPLEIPSGIEIIASLVDSTGFSNTRVSRRLVTSPGSDLCLADRPMRPNDIEVGLSTTTFTTCQDFVAAWPDTYRDTSATVVGMIPSGDIWQIARTEGGANSVQAKVRYRPDRKAIVSVWGDGSGAIAGFAGSADLTDIRNGNTPCSDDSTGIPITAAPSTAAGASGSLSAQAVPSSTSGITGGSNGTTTDEGAGEIVVNANSSPNIPAVAGGIIGGAFLIALLFLLLSLYRKRQRQRANPAPPRVHLYRSNSLGRSTKVTGTIKGKSEAGSSLAFAAFGRTRNNRETMGSVDSGGWTPRPLLPRSYAGSDYLSPTYPASIHTQNSRPPPSPTPSMRSNPVGAVRTFAAQHLTPDRWYNEKVVAAQRRDAEMRRDRDRERVYVEAQDGGRVIEEGEARDVVEMPPRYDRVQPAKGGNVV